MEIVEVNLVETLGMIEDLEETLEIVSKYGNRIIMKMRLQVDLIQER